MFVTCCSSLKHFRCALCIFAACFCIWLRCKFLQHFSVLFCAVSICSMFLYLVPLWVFTASVLSNRWRCFLNFLVFFFICSTLSSLGHCTFPITSPYQMVWNNKSQSSLNMLAIIRWRETFRFSQNINEIQMKEGSKKGDTEWYTYISICHDDGESDKVHLHTGE